MPEIRFKIEWPNGQQEVCYSPSLVIKQYLSENEEYSLADFMDRARAALKEGSDRVAAKFGFPCSLALGQLQRLEVTAKEFGDRPIATVKLLQFIE